uniref:G-protein coupled receptors family 1 profile domain-containing protein n=1 Tax=Pan troglodytes TaxID=9598 RepID=A0A2I3TQ72_PANTR
MRNHTLLNEFILWGIPQTEGLEAVLCAVFSFIYLFTLLGNLLILIAIVSSSTLHTPMYFFLGLLSTFDILFPSVTCPKMLLYLSGQSPVISFKGCASQLFFYHLLGSAEGCLYSVMSYDRFVAIRHPLRYMLIMKPRVCVGLVVVAGLVGCLHATILTSFTFQLSYCGPNQRVGSINVGFLALTLLISVCVCYTRIGIAILRIRSSEGRQKAFSTCSAHLVAILCAYGPVQILNNVVSPMLNSLIYSLRNKEVKRSLKRVFRNVLLTVCE